MLQAMRDRVMGLLGWVIIGLIIITFALFGLGSYLQDKTRIYAAKVNGDEIGPRDLQLAYQQQRAQMEQMLGDAFNPALIDDQVIKQRALNALIRRHLVLQAAKAEGVMISDQLLAAQIQSVPAFQEEGAFSEERYQRLLAQQAQTPAGFEHNTRQILLAEQLVNGLSQTAFVTEQELNRAYRLQDQKRDFNYLVIAAEPFKAKADISDDRIRQYYEQHTGEYMVPERVRLAYLRLTGDTLGETIEVDEEEVQAYYREKKESLATQEQRQASHILIQVPAEADEATIGKAQAQADELLVKIRAGEDFAALAKEHSDDPGSAAQGGDLGLFGRGTMVPEFEKTVFGMQIDAVSEPVRTQFGFHIIKLVDIRGSEIPALEKVRDELITELKQRSVDDLFYEQLEKLTDSSYENPESLDVAADIMDLEVQTSDWLTATGGPGIGEYPKLMAAAFSEDVLEAGNNSEPVEVGGNDVIVVRVAEREAAHPSPLESVKDRVIEAIKQQQSSEQAKAKGEELLEQLKQGSSLEALKDQDGYTFHQAEAVTRAAPGHAPEVVRQAFKVQRPEEGASVETGFALSNGDYAVLHLTKVSDADPASMEEAARTQLQRGYENMRRSLMLSTMVENLRGRAEIVIPQESE